MDLSLLNDRQKEAVTAPLGPVLVLAGAGSGKTRALAFRIAYLCEKKLVDPGRILALTFTNKAAKEMQDRVTKILKDQPCSIPHMGTFHSICARILRQEIPVLGYTRGFAIFDTDDQLKVLKEIIADLHIDRKFGPSLFKAYISSAKNILQAPAEMDLGLEADMGNLARKVYVRYQDFLYRQNALDFDDLLMLVVKIFQTFPPVLEKYRNLFKYILVDEYQDTNHAQYVFLYLLAEKHHNLFVVGDDAQSIYGFRGSNIRNILNFENDFSESLVIKLEQNYRSTQNILAVAQKVIELNPEQKPKTLWTSNETGQKIAVEETPDERAEAVFVAKRIISLSTGQKDELDYEPEDSGAAGFSILDQFLKKAKRAGRRVPAGFSFLPQLPKDHESLNQFAVLFRTHAQSRVLEEIFIESGIPYQIVGGVKFYERKEIKDLLAYLRLTLNYRDIISLKRVINEPARGVGDKSFAIVKDLIMKDSISVGAGLKPSNALDDFIPKLEDLPLAPKAKAGVLGFFDLLNRFSYLDKNENLVSLMRLIIKASKMEDWLRDGSEVGEGRWENVQELVSVTEKFKSFPWREGLERFLEEVSLLSEVDEMNETKDMVTLMTLHSAKGLEFDTVFLVGLEEGILPHSRSLLNPSELSEEVRLAYVGLTRARKYLFLTYARSRRGFGGFQSNAPSRILRALPKDKIVRHGQEEVYYESEDEEIDY